MAPFFQAQTGHTARIRGHPHRKPSRLHSSSFFIFFPFLFEQMNPTAPRGVNGPRFHALRYLPRSPELVGERGPQLPAAAPPGHHGRRELPAARRLPG